jgi:prepilin-type N-terminal cleavage/methylation domain-containing protein
MSRLPSPRRRPKKGSDPLNARGQTPFSGRAGFTLLELLVVIAIIGLLMGLMMPAVQKAREAANRISCANNLKQIALAMHHYELNRGSLPPRTTAENGGASWAVLIMPYMEQENLYNRWDLTRPYYLQSDVARQSALQNYFCPSRRTAAVAGLSVSGDQAWLGGGFGTNVPGALGDYAACTGMDPFG